MRILVTGSQGTLGRPLLEELRARGHEAWGTDLRHDSDPRYVRADVAVCHQLEAAFMAAEPSFVYHLAAEFGRLNGEQWTEQLWRTAMVGTRNVLDLCAAHEARLAFASSSEVYGELEADWLEETATDGAPILHLNEYALSKWTNERQILSYQRRYGLDAVRLRFFNAYGPGEAYHPYRSVVALFCHRALLDKALPVYADYWRTFMHLDDFTPTLANVCEADLHWSVYNIGGVDFRAVEELADIVLEQAGAGDIDLVAEDRHNVRSKRPVIERAQTDLDHHPTIDLEAGVPTVIEWMKAQVPK